ncbi:MAG: 50S ribosomal protein L22, partial [Phycisphaerae bacterium]
MGKQSRPRALPENEVRAIGRTSRVSPRKLNLVAEMIRGKKASTALAELTFSKRRIAQTTGVREVSNQKARDVQVAGYEAHEIVADAKEADAPGSLLLYQVVVPDGKGYWLVQGIVGADRAPEFLP